ncbi:Uncharacterised protein [Mycobacteroides abscessus subsp. massiliense]|nr:Uncharacterised protein [Mycobacteroides abscessus subsp. massiliense]
MREAPIEGGDNTHSSSVFGALDALCDIVAAAQPIDLEVRLGVRGHHILDGLARERGQAHSRAACGRGSRHGNLAVRVDGLHSGGRNHDWQ